MTASLLKRTLYLIALATFAAFLWQYTKRGTPKALPKGIKLPKEIAEDITIFHRPNCIYCLRAKYFFDERSLHYEEINLNENKEAYKELTKLMKRVTVPQIFIGDYHVGGYSDLIELSEEELRLLLYP